MEASESDHKIVVFHRYPHVPLAKREGEDVRHVLDDQPLDEQINCPCKPTVLDWDGGSWVPR